MNNPGSAVPAAHPAPDTRCRAFVPFGPARRTVVPMDVSRRDHDPFLPDRTPGPLTLDDLLVLAALAVCWTPSSIAVRYPLPAGTVELLAASTARFHPARPPAPTPELLDGWSDLLDAVARLAPVFAELYGEGSLDRASLVLRSICWSVFDLAAARASSDPHQAALFRNSSVEEVCRAARYARLHEHGCFDPLGSLLARRDPERATLTWLRSAVRSAVLLRVE